ncbi:DUF397 domain-containing protein [Streptomyces sp. bgisy022]|uniref:DUF397 domain-containing protein n=1 Tax=Streptomyces sp. bgisy022 TaxID=3413769 RepID=UPI003D761F31
MAEALNWWKSTYSSGGDGDTCVEIAEATAHRRICVRDSKAPARGVLSVPVPSFALFIEHLKHHP